MHTKAKRITVLLTVAIVVLLIFHSMAVSDESSALPPDSVTVTLPSPTQESTKKTDETTDEVEPVTVVKETPEFLHIEDIPLTNELQEVMQTACKNYNVPYALVLAVAEAESCFDLDADNGLCWGIMQINPCNYDRLRENGIEPTEYEGNIVAGVFLLGELLEKYGDTHKALMAYNCGETGAARLWKQGYSTSSYSRNVTLLSEKWQQIIKDNGGNYHE